VLTTLCAGFISPSDLDADIGWKRLGDDISVFGAMNELTALVPPLEGVCIIGNDDGSSDK